MYLTRLADSFTDSLLTVVYPQTCVSCSGSVESRLFGVVCEECWSATSLIKPDDAICWKCGVAFVGKLTVAREEVSCNLCDDQLFTAARACGLYDGALRHSVLHLKNTPKIAKHLLGLLTSIARTAPLNRSTRLIPVPLHPLRQEQRGFNQASVIARTLAKALLLPLDEKSLLRTTFTGKHRAGLDARGRIETVAGAFSVRYPRSVLEEEILLVDDVFTTGATASACAKALLEAGARTVSVLTIARAR